MTSSSSPHAPSPAPERASPPQPAARDRSALALAVLVVVAVGALWLRWLGSSLWLDETGTAWVVEDGWREVVERSRFQGQTPAYYLIAWAARSLGGASEVVLRLPSLVAMLAAVWLVARIGRRLVDARTGWLAAVVFAALGGIAFAAVDARPYAIALATFLAATLALMRWLDEGRPIFGVAYALAGAATIAFTYMFAVALIPHAVYAVVRSRQDARVGLGALGAAGVGIVVLLLPALPHLRALLTEEGITTAANSGVNASTLFASLVPASLVVGLLGGLLVARATGRLHLARPPARAHALVLAIALAVVPPVVFYALAELVTPKLFIVRYFLPAAAGLALLAALGIRALGPTRAQVVVVAAVIAASAATFSGREHALEDWRAAAARANTVADEATPVLVRTAFGTTQLDDERRRGLLLAPLRVYPIRGEPILLPLAFEPDGRRALDAALPRLTTHPRFLLVTRAPFDAFEPWLDGRLAPLGYRARSLYAKGDIRVIVFERAS